MKFVFQISAKSLLYDQELYSHWPTVPFTEIMTDWCFNIFQASSQFSTIQFCYNVSLHKAIDELGNTVCITRAEMVIMQFWLGTRQPLKSYFGHNEQKNPIMEKRVAAKTFTYNLTTAFRCHHFIKTQLLDSPWGSHLNWQQSLLLIHAMILHLTM